MTQIFVASTLYGTVSLCAAMDAGMFGPDERRILLVSDNASLPELSTPVDRTPGFAPLAARFTEVLSWNAELHPLHPSGWMPRTEDLPLLERLFRDRWRLGAEPLELVVDTIAASPARALASIFYDAAVTVYSEGLMSYAPTRSSLPNGVGTQIVRQLHLDLVPGLEPQLLREYGVPAETIPDAAFRALLDKLHADLAPLVAEQSGKVSGASLDGAALIVGQYLAALDILTETEETELHLRLLRGAAARGHRTVLFKPHPASPARARERLAAEAERLGVRLGVLDAPIPAEVWCAAIRPELIAGCFSTALVTASRYFGVPAATAGTTALLDGLAPYENSNRIPVSVIDALLPHLAADGTLSEPRIAAQDVEAELAPLIATIAYCMQAGARPDLRQTAVGYLGEHSGTDVMRYFKRRRLTALELPGGLGRAHPKVLNTVLPRSSRRRQVAVSVLRRAERLRTQSADNR